MKVALYYIFAVLLIVLAGVAVRDYYQPKKVGIWIIPKDIPMEFKSQDSK